MRLTKEQPKGLSKLLLLRTDGGRLLGLRTTRSLDLWSKVGKIKYPTSAIKQEKGVMSNMVEQHEVTASGLVALA